MAHIDVTGGELYVETDGDPANPAVLLIHAGIATLRMWDPIVPQLSADHYVIRYDTRGFGKTRTENVEFSNRADALAVLDDLGVQRATLVGASRGGVIAIDTALEFPERVAGLVVVGGAPSGFSDVDLTTHEDQLFDAIDAAYEKKDWERMLRLEVEVWSFGPHRTADELDPGFVQTAYDLNLANLPHVEEDPSPIPIDPPAVDRLGDIDVPALIMVGEHDVSETLVQYEYLLSTLSDATGARFPDAAHLPSVEQPGDFVRVLTDWLRANRL
ncbi:alpha/beta fold hydrolase [Diaminobutyricimonas sp. LJ205]|uniref:alpha/beta fold hydrolase n=1 Tax=Diaminobutyricimonas sp. LJ205 TaxID=2683590 RepID=UPI0012F499F0|nr:alpha/beta fold hydrolase [Diaminobutyricimonas sp. LJ205]